MFFFSFLPTEQLQFPGTQYLVALSVGQLRVIAGITCTHIKQTGSPEITIPVAFLQNINRRSPDSSRLLIQTCLFFSPTRKTGFYIAL